MPYSFRNPSDGIIKHYLETSKIIAVLDYLTVKIRPVIVLARRCKSGAIGLFLSTLKCSVAKILGERVYASLQEIPSSRYRRCLPSQWVFARCSVTLSSRMRRFSGTIGAGKSRSRRNPSWSWTRRYRHEPLYQTRAHSFGLRRRIAFDLSQNLASFIRWLNWYGDEIQTDFPNRDKRTHGALENGSNRRWVFRFLC